CSVEGLSKLLKALSPQNICGVYSHMYAPESPAARESQLRLFNLAESAVKSKNAKAVAHFAASGGIALGGDYLKDGVRCGLALYGYVPNGFEIKGLKPALKVYARLAQSTLFVPQGIGYNVADKDYKRLYTYRLGYGDGFLRGVPLGEKTLCMDAFISQENKELLPVFTDADEYARRCGTISYEVLCSVTKRSEIVYERGSEI
ncbi:MAG: alanine racemase, partial [Candidatus Coproplasma sp.]